LEHVVCSPELPDATHYLDPERNGPALLLQPPAEPAELLDDRLDRVRACSSEQESWVEDDELGAARLRDAGRVVEHPDRHIELLPAVRVPHEPGDRRVNGENDPGVTGKLAEPRGPRIVH